MARYRFDPYLLDTDARVLKRQGEPVVTTPKVLETLTVLVRNRGRVMDKDELLRTLWPDTAVEEANLTQNVSTLRKILGDDSKNHRYIATIPGRGYSFVAAVNEAPSEKDEIPAQRRPWPRLWAEHRRRLYVGVTVCILLTGTVLYFTYPKKRHLSEPQISRFTSFPGVETMPAFSPDGKQLAYVRAEHDPISLDFPRRQVGQANIYTKLIGAATELRLTRHSGADYYPAWSPDGQYIAFYRDEPGASGCYIVSALGGHERRITHEEAQSVGIAWFPDGRRLVMSHASDGFNPSPLVEISLDTGEQRALTSPPAGSQGDVSPAVSHDGKTLAFLRLKDQSAVDACFWRFSDETIRCWPLDGSWTEGFAWTASGDEIIVSATRTVGRRLWRYPVNGGTPVALTSGEEEAELPAISRQGDQLAYALSRMNVNLWQLDVGPSGVLKGAVTKPIASSTRVQCDPALSPDGRKIAYTSNRSGSLEIWLSDTETQTSVQLTHFDGPPVGSPSWSPDGLQIAFDVILGPHPDIFIIPADGGKPRRISAISGENVVPSWSQDGRSVYFASSRSGEFQIWRVLAATGETPSHPAIQVTQGGGFRAFESVDGKYLYYAKGRGKRGLWRRSLLTSSTVKEEPILESLQDWGWWSLGPGVVYFFEEPHSINPRVRLKALNMADGRIRELYTLTSPVLTSTPVMAVSRDGQHLAYAQIDSTDADLILLKNFR